MHRFIYVILQRFNKCPRLIFWNYKQLTKIVLFGLNIQFRQFKLQTLKKVTADRYTRGYTYVILIFFLFSMRTTYEKPFIRFSRF